MGKKYAFSYDLAGICIGSMPNFFIIFKMWNYIIPKNLQLLDFFKSSKRVMTCVLFPSGKQIVRDNHLTRITCAGYSKRDVCFLGLEFDKITRKHPGQWEISSRRWCRLSCATSAIRGLFKPKTTTFVLLEV